MTWVLVHRLNPRAAPVESGAGWRRHPRNAGSARRCLHGVLFGQQVAAIVEKAWAFYRRDIGSYDTIDNHNTAGISVFTALGVDYTKVETENFANGAAYLSAIKSALDAGKGVWLGAVGGLSDDTPMRMDDPTTDENESTYRRGAHIYTVDAVLTDAAGNPTGIRLYDPHGSFGTITNLDVIYFCSGSFGYFNF